MVILDTSVIIDHLRQDPSSSSLLAFSKKSPREEIGISIISLQELYQGESTRQTQKENHLLATVSGLQVLPYTYEVAELAGKISRDSEYDLEFVDAAIAATTIHNGAKLFTLNKKHFVNIPDLELRASKVI